MADDPVTFKFCDERSAKILTSIDGLEAAVNRIADSHEVTIKEQGVKLDKVCDEFIRLDTRIESGVLGRDLSNRRAVIIIAGLMVFITLLGNMDKIASLWR